MPKVYQGMTRPTLGDWLLFNMFCRCLPMQLDKRKQLEKVKKLTSLAEDKITNLDNPREFSKVLGCILALLYINHLLENIMEENTYIIANKKVKIWE